MILRSAAFPHRNDCSRSPCDKSISSGRELAFICYCICKSWLNNTATWTMAGMESSSMEATDWHFCFLSDYVLRLCGKFVHSKAVSHTIPSSSNYGLLFHRCRYILFSNGSAGERSWVPRQNVVPTVDLSEFAVPIAAVINRLRGLSSRCVSRATPP